MIDINIHKPSGNINIHQEDLTKSRSIAVPLIDCEDPTFIQVHGNNTHYYGDGIFL